MEAGVEHARENVDKRDIVALARGMLVPVFFLGIQSQMIFLYYRIVFYVKAEMGSIGYNSISSER